MTNAKKGVFQITVDLKNLNNFCSSCYKMSIQNGISKFKILQNIFFDKILSDPFTLQFTAGIKLLNSELLKNSMASRQIQAISFHLIAMINQLM